jgi:hypothetical protein
MSDFGGLVRDDTSEDKSEAKTPESKAKSSSKSNASLASVLGADDVASLTRKYDLDPELGERVLVPLVNFLDKYGVGDAVNESPTVSGIMSLAEFWNDIAPVVKNAADYFGGRQKTLSEDDREFLERIRQAQEESADLSLFQDSETTSIGESIVETPPEPIEIVDDPFTSGKPIDWSQMLGAGKTQSNHYETSSTLQKQETQFGISGLEQLAREAGLSIEEVQAKDGQNKINGADASKTGLDYLAEDNNLGSVIDSGTSKIQAAMKTQAEHYERTSQAQFDEMETPESALKYDPLAVAGLEPPAALEGGGLESMESLMAKAGVSAEDIKTQSPADTVLPTDTDDQVDNYEEVVLPEDPGIAPAETFMVDFSDYEVLE